MVKDADAVLAVCVKDMAVISIGVGSVDVMSIGAVM